MKLNTRILIYPLLMVTFLMLSTSCSKTDTNDPTPSGSTVTDIDGNVYHTVKIGTQTWMVENLKVTKYNDGSSIPNVTDNKAWNNITTPGYCWYNNDVVNKNIYGALYNWNAVNTGKLCPLGWHVPSKTEWDKFDTDNADVQLKEIGTVHWKGPNDATNETGFTALPGGERDLNGVFWYLGESGSWWSTTEMNPLGYDAIFSEILNYDQHGLGNGYPEKLGNRGFSVRCIKD